MEKMSKSRIVVWVLSKTCNALITIFLFLVLLLGCYVFWDTKIVHTQASATRWQPYKPTEKNVIDFDELRRLNPDVDAWITIYGTGVDYPVMYHPDTTYYFLRDPLGINSSSGSIFMDGDCSRDFSDFNTILYGHHMEAHAMFGDIPNFSSKDYFDTHLYGNLFYEGKNYGLQIGGLLRADAYDTGIYKTNIQSGREEYIRLLHSKSLQWRDIGLNANDRLVLCSTCSGQETNGRSVLVCALRDNTYENTFEPIVDTGPGIDVLQGLFGFPWIGWFTALIVLLVIVIFVLWKIDREINKHKNRNNASNT